MGASDKEKRVSREVKMTAEGRKKGRKRDGNVPPGPGFHPCLSL
jgi:hypothetical protein